MNDLFKFGFQASRKSQSGVYRENPSVLSSKSRSDWSQESTPWSDVPEDRISSLGEQKKGDEIQVSSQMRQCEEAESDEELEQLQTDEVNTCPSCPPIFLASVKPGCFFFLSFRS